MNLKYHQRNEGLAVRDRACFNLTLCTATTSVTMDPPQDTFHVHEDVEALSDHTVDEDDIGAARSDHTVQDDEGELPHELDDDFQEASSMPQGAFFLICCSRNYAPSFVQ